MYKNVDIKVSTVTCKNLILEIEFIFIYKTYILKRVENSMVGVFLEFEIPLWMHNILPMNFSLLIVWKLSQMKTLIDTILSLTIFDFDENESYTK